MKRKLNLIKLITAVFCFSSCATQSSYMPLVVTTSAADQEKFENDLAECIEYLESVEEDGRLAEVARGAAVGTAVGVVGASAILGTAAGTTAAVRGRCLGRLFFFLQPS